MPLPACVLSYSSWHCTQRIAVGSACRRASRNPLPAVLAQPVTALGQAHQRTVDPPQLVGVAIDFREVEIDDQVRERIVLDVARLLGDPRVRLVGGAIERLLDLAAQLRGALAQARLSRALGLLRIEAGHGWTLMLTVGTVETRAARARFPGHNSAVRSMRHANNESPRHPLDARGRHHVLGDGCPVEAADGGLPCDAGNVPARRRRAAAAARRERRVRPLARSGRRSAGTCMCCAASSASRCCGASSTQ